MPLQRALLEDWLRDYYYDLEVDLGCSGVEDFSFGELRRLVGLRQEDLDAIFFHDSRSLGGLGIRQAIADRFTRGEIGRVMVTHGSTEANFLLMNTLLKPGDEVIALDPMYQQLYGVADGIGCLLKLWQLRFDNSFHPELEELRGLMTPETRMVIVNFPHNPTGVSMTPEEQRELVRIVAETGAYLVWDGAFAELTYGRPPLPDPLFEYELVVSMGTLSKAYGLPGLRVGWCLAAPAILESFIVLRDYTLLSLSPLIEQIAERVLAQGDRLVSMRREQARRNLARLAAWVEGNQDRVEWVPPQGGVSTFLRLHSSIDVEAFCHRLAQEHSVLLVPGACFGQPQHVRLGFGGASASFDRGLDAVSRLLHEVHPRTPGGSPQAMRGRQAGTVAAPKGGPKKFVLIIPDGAADLHREASRSPLGEASIRYWDWVAAEGVCGLMQTLYPDLPRGSIIAQLGMLGWDPYEYSGHGRSVWELLGLDGEFKLGPSDLVFRANLVQMVGARLASYNAGFILSEQAIPLVERINAATHRGFPHFELYHNCDFRNSLVLRDAGVAPALLDCPEPHENEGAEFDPARLISGSDPASAAVAARMNSYLVRVAGLLAGGAANMLFPWSASRAFKLPLFRENTGFEGRAAIVGCMDFLQGIAKVGGIDFFRIGNGRPDTDYAAKGAKVLELLESGYSFVVCHVNSPDEAAHMRDRPSKIFCLEAIDQHIVAPVVKRFRSRPEELGGLMIVPDHYTALLLGTTRVDAHSLDPVPFASWNGRNKDSVTRFDEDSVRAGRYGNTPVSHLDLLRMLGVVEGEDRLEPQLRSLPGISRRY